MSGSAEHWIEAAGVGLRVVSSGRPLGGDASSTAASPVLLLHGFTGCIESMEAAQSALGVSRPVVAVDLVGHGGSECPEAARAYTMPACVEQLVAVLDALELSRVHALGYSMGGRVALSLAAAHPDRVCSLMLVGASPGLADAAERAARCAADEALATRIEEEGLLAFVDFWMALPLFASQARLGRDSLERARRLRLAGNPVGWAGSLRGMGTGAMPPLHAALPEIQAPTCLIAGQEDSKFMALAEMLSHALPHAECAFLESAGHAAHLENPDSFARIAREFLRRCDAEGPEPVRRVSTETDRAMPRTHQEIRS